MKKVAVVGTVGIPACYGGFESLVENITLFKSDNTKYTVFCSSKSYDEQLTSHNDSELIYIPLNANGIQSIFYDIWSLLKCLKLNPDCVLILGVSGCVFLPIFTSLTKSKVIVNIDGLEWKRDKWSSLVKRFLKYSEKIAIKYSNVVVTDNQAISDYVSEEYGVDTTTIAYGGDHAIRNTIVDLKNTNESYALGLCRIEPENNVELILEAFSRMDNQLKFIGNWDNSDFGKFLRKKYNQFQNIELLDPIYDLDELYKLRRNCKLYLHGHSAGGTNPSLVEMMHFGCTIFAYDCSFNKYSTRDKAFYFSSADDLVDAVNRFSEGDYINNGEYMLSIARNNYTWRKISLQYESTYEVKN